MPTEISMSLNCDRVWHRRRSSMTTCSFLCRVARRKGMQSCYFLVCIGWMWYGITISWAWQTNCIGSIEGFSRSNRYFYQTIAVRRNLNQTSWNDWTFRRPHVWQDLPAQNCWQMPQVFICTDEWYKGQLPTYTRCLAATRSSGDVRVRHMSTLDDAGRGWSKLGRFGLARGWKKASSRQYGQHYQKHHKHAKNWNTGHVKGFMLGTVVHAKKYILSCTDLCRCQGRCATRLI